MRAQRGMELAFLCANWRNITWYKHAHHKMIPPPPQPDRSHTYSTKVTTQHAAVSRDLMLKITMIQIYAIRFIIFAKLLLFYLYNSLGCSWLERGQPPCRRPDESLRGRSRGPGYQRTAGLRRGQLHEACTEHSVMRRKETENTKEISLNDHIRKNVSLIPGHKLMSVSLRANERHSRWNAYLLLNEKMSRWSLTCY